MIFIQYRTIVGVNGREWALDHIETAPVYNLIEFRYACNFYRSQRNLVFPHKYDVDDDPKTPPGSGVWNTIEEIVYIHTHGGSGSHSSVSLLSSFYIPSNY